MSNVHEIEDAVRELPPAELAKFREWFAAFDAASWDRELETDVGAGRLDTLADAAIAEHQAGLTSPRRSRR